MCYDFSSKLHEALNLLDRGIARHTKKTKLMNFANTYSKYFESIHDNKRF